MLLFKYLVKRNETEIRCNYFKFYVFICYNTQHIFKFFTTIFDVYLKKYNYIISF